MKNTFHILSDFLTRDFYENSDGKRERGKPAEYGIRYN